MKTENLLKLITMAKNVEEQAVASFSLDIEAALEWLSVGPDDKKLIRRGFKKLHKQSMQHFQILCSLEKMIRKDGKDVY